MKCRILGSSIFLMACLIFSTLPALASESNEEYLIIYSGESLTLSGEVIRTKGIYIENGGTLTIADPDNTENFGDLTLIAPQIVINGTIDGEGKGYNAAGKGGPPPATSCGGGGAGHGGKGGDGENTGTAGEEDKAYPGNGGPVYDSIYEALTGSYGFGSQISAYPGRGGGSIRLDAMSLTLGANALILGQAYQTRPQGAFGGGSGGDIFLNGITTHLKSGYTLSVLGGPGGHSSHIFGASGGGGGGRIKFIQYANFLDEGTGESKKLSGGTGGTGNHNNGADGESGIFAAISAPLPNTPTLISPNNNAVVGTQPTFAFMANDPAGSKFLKYKIDISPSATFPMPVSITADQVTDSTDPGWSKPYYRSDETASYAVSLGELAQGQEYFWRVWVTNDNGNNWVQSSTYRRITTTSTPNAGPLTPQPLLPEADASAISKYPSFQVLCADPEGDTLTVKLYLSTDAGMSNAKTFDTTYSGWSATAYYPEGAYAGITATCQIDTSDALSPGLDYYWQAECTDQFSQSSLTAIMHFATVDRPTIPVIDSPGNSTVVTTKQPALTMLSQSPTSSSMQYKVELSSDDFQTVLVFQSEGGGGWSQTSYTHGDPGVLNIPGSYALVPGKTYQWRTAGYDVDNENWSIFTGLYEFTVITPPLTPVIIAPENNYLAPDSQITFQFKAPSESGDTLTGRIEIGDNQSGNLLYQFDQAGNQSGWSEAYYYSNSIMACTIPSAATFTPGKTYWWRACATNGISTGPVSETRYFSLADSLSITSLKVAPNPAVSVNQLSIFVQLTLDSRVTIHFFNKNGQHIDQKSLHVQGGEQGMLIKHDISSYASGVYFFTLEAESNRGSKKVTRKFAIVK